MVQTIRPYGFISEHYVKNIIEKDGRYFIVQPLGTKIETTQEEYEKWNHLERTANGTK